jgi:hypothetical protein
MKYALITLTILVIVVASPLTRAQDDDVQCDENRINDVLAAAISDLQAVEGSSAQDQLAAVAAVRAELVALESACAGSDFEANTMRDLWWSRFDVTIDNIDTSANRFRVTESYIIEFGGGPYSYGFAWIPLDRVMYIDSINVYDDGTQLNHECTDTAGNVCVTTDGKNMSIKYYFLYPVQTAEQRRIRLEYTVYGALRSYYDGDELYWVALPADLSGFDVDASHVVVVMPDDVPPLKWTSYPAEGWTVTTEGNTLTWVSPPRPSDDGSFEVRIKYPHNPAMMKPSWQTDDVSKWE